jgi:hypothetical protein
LYVRLGFRGISLVRVNPKIFRFCN